MPVRTNTRPRTATLALVLALFAAACGGAAQDAADDAESAAGEAVSEATGGASEEPSAAPSEEPSEMGSEMASEMGSEMASEVSGAMIDTTCQVELPSDGEGSATGMADDAVGTAASNNPALSTLVTALSQADLVDTLNDTSQQYTVFAPTNDAFAKIPAADLQAVLADNDLLTSILTLHVVPGEQLDAAALAEAGSVATVNGQELTLAAEGGSLNVNGQAAVICPNVMTANATVHLIDTVLMPQG